jgi:hypothetical protein
MPRRSLLLVTGALFLSPVPVLAQDKRVAIYFEPCDRQQLNDAVTAALTKPPFLLLTKYTSDALIVSIPDRITIDRQQKGATWTYTVLFRRNGDSLGQSVESCNDKTLSDCTDQLVSDIKSAAGLGP